MRLWTMQTPDVDLGDIHYTVDHSKSQYAATFPKYPALCKRLSEQLQLGTDQYVWCLLQDENTWDGCGKWEFNVPDEYVRLICSITWHWILTRSNEDDIKCTPPEEIYDICWTLNINMSRKSVGFTRDTFSEQFHSVWREKNPDELWDMLEVHEVGNTCTTALVLLPVADWITSRLR